MGSKYSNPLVWVPVIISLGILAGIWYWFALEKDIELQFQLFRSSAPSRIYARAPVIFLGMDVEDAELAKYLDRVGYRNVTGDAVGSGEYKTGAHSWIIGIRPFAHANGTDVARQITVLLDENGRVSGMRSEQRDELKTVRIEPAEIGAFVPADGKDRLPVSLSEVPDYLVNAVLATEDRRFFEHDGIDLRRIAGAMLANLKNRRIVEGASTITQQLVKNLYLSRERTLIRKLHEVLIALMLEGLHSKQEILEAYLNILYLGQDGATAIHGVGLAAHYYFGKDIHDLGLPESALLTGIIRSPSLHSPFSHPQAARERRNFVLDQMLEQETITRSEYEQAVAAPLGLRPPFERIDSTMYFVDYLRKELADRYDSRTLEEGGLSIYTTLDLRMQDLAEQTIRKRLEKLENGSENLKQDYSPLQGSMVVLEPRTGQILVFIGGRDYKQSPFNRALAHRQPGSIFKPVVMLAALARGDNGEPEFTLASILKDEPFDINVMGARWQPMNYDRKFRGEVTAREALERSLNVPMAQLGAAVGYTQIISTARRMGITSPLEPVPSLPIGSFEVTLLEMARAYAVLASGGLRAPLRSVLSIVEPDESSHWTPKVTPYRIFRSSETYLVTSALQGGIDRGTSTHFRDLGYYGAVAGKTGSTNRFHDAWFVGYTPEIVVGAWVGFDFARDLGISGAAAALPAVADFMIGVLGRNGAARFSRPPGVEHVTVAIKQNGTCRHLTEFFLSGTAPPSDCPEDGNMQESTSVVQPLEVTTTAAPAAAGFAYGSIAISPGATQALLTYKTLDSRQLRLCDLSSFTCNPEVTSMQPAITGEIDPDGYTLSPSGKLAFLAQAAATGGIKNSIYNVENGVLVNPQTLPVVDRILRILFTPDETRAVVRTATALVSLDLSTNAIVASMRWTATDFFSFPQVSPDGRFLAYYSPARQSSPIRYFRIVDFSKSKIYSLSQRIDYWDLLSEEHVLFQFSPDNTYLLYKDDREGPQTLYKVDLAKLQGDTFVGTRVFNQAYTVSDFMLAQDPDTLLYLANRVTPLRFDLFRHNMKSGVLTTVLTNASYYPRLKRVGELLFVNQLTSWGSQPVAYNLKTGDLRALPQPGGTFAAVKPGTDVTLPAGVHGALLLPDNFNPKAQHQLVIWLHGGPYRQTSLGYHPYPSYGVYDWILESLRSSGVMVLKVDYSGSFGYGRPFAESLKENVGVKDVNDVLAALRSLKSKYNVGNVHLMGVSYGGYLALRTLVQSPGSFASAISVNGVSDWLTIVNNNPSTIFTVDFQGPLSFTNQQLYDRASIWTLLPGLSNQKVILLHSTADSEVSFSQATKLEGILKIAGKNVALTPLPNDDHVLGLQSSATTVCTTTFQALGIVPVDKCAF